MNVLVINCGSSSLKYQLIDSETEAVLAKGLCERIGIDGRLVYQKAGNDKEITEASMPTHKEAIQMVLEALTNEKTGAIKSLDEVNAIGHRIVHGGEKFASSAIITDEMIKSCRRVQRPCSSSQPCKPDRYPRMLLSLCRMYRRLVYSIPLSIRQCLQKHICTDFRSSTTRTTK